MKKTAFASAALSIIVLIIGLLFMLHELPYSNYILAISLFLLAASMIVFYNLDKRVMYIAGSIFCFLPMVGILFRQLSLPGSTLPTRLVAMGEGGKGKRRVSAQTIAGKLRKSEICPVVGRISEDVLLLDPRSVLPEEDEIIIGVLRNIAAELS